MTYRTTRARQTFESQLEQAIQEIAPLYRETQRGGGGSGARLLAAYYVFAFGQLEVYIKTLVEDSLNAVILSRPTFDKWPDLMVAFLLHKGESLESEYRRFSQTEDEGRVLLSVASTARKVAAWGSGGAMPGALDARAFLDKKKYPSPKNLPQLFRRLGINHIWAVMDSAGKMNSQLLLKSLNDLRTDIVHEGQVPPGFGLNDFRDRITQMRRIVGALDRGLSKHFCSRMMPRATWNGAMA